MICAMCSNEISKKARDINEYKIFNNKDGKQTQTEVCGHCFTLVRVSEGVEQLRLQQMKQFHVPNQNLIIPKGIG